MKESVPESEEKKFRQKCIELKKRIVEVEESNEIASIALSRSRTAIRRLRLEHSILLERLESRAIVIPDGNVDDEEMTPPPSPSILDESLNNSNTKLTRNGLSKKGKRKSGVNSTSGNGSNNSRVQKIRDPDLPKRPTNAYLIFCEMEKDRIRKELEEQSDGNVTDLSKTLTETWKNLNDEDRKPYYKLYEDDRERYQREMLVYNKRKQADDSVPSKKQKLENAGDAENIAKDSPALDTSPIKEDASDEISNADSQAQDEQASGVAHSEPVNPAEPSTEIELALDEKSDVKNEDVENVSHQE